MSGNKLEAMGTGSRRPVIVTGEQYLSKFTHTLAATYIVKSNYNGFPCLLKRLIITANNYSAPELSWERG